MTLQIVQKLPEFFSHLQVTKRMEKQTKIKWRLHFRGILLKNLIKATLFAPTLRVCQCKFSIHLSV